MMREDRPSLEHRLATLDLAAPVGAAEVIRRLQETCEDKNLGVPGESSNWSDLADATDGGDPVSVREAQPPSSEDLPTTSSSPGVPPSNLSLAAAKVCHARRGRVARSFSWGADCSTQPAQSLGPAMLLQWLFRRPRHPWAADRVEEGLFLGSYETVCQKEHLLSLGVSRILTVARGLQPLFPETFKYTLVEIQDAGHVDIASHFEGCFEVIEEGRSSGGVVVHCIKGISRSVTIVVAYLMKTKLLTLRKALSHVRRVRPMAKPNMGFMRQLQKYEDKLATARRRARRPPKKCI